ncbi:cation transmembrane transporter [Aureococcus anophagefferens]|uniref:Cation transmembrane transporter n=1 Tax=Aureococcus anophagefferens TaxID=44056 RepID=A0ABR1FN36_AURAN
MPEKRPVGISLASGSSSGWRLRISGTQLGHYATAQQAWAAPARRPRKGAGGAPPSHVGITAVGAVVNVGLGCCKVGAGSTLGSPALIADGAHSLSDVLTDVVAYWSYAAARLPPDADHPFGHGKFEAGGSAVAGGSLAAGAGARAHHAAGSVFEPAEALELYAVATSVAALAGIAGGHGLGVAIADPVAGVVAGRRRRVPGAKIARDARARELLDETLDGQRVARLERAVAAAVPRCDFSLRARKAGPGVLVDLRLGVEKGLSASAAHQIGEHAKVALGREARAMGLGLADVAAAAADAEAAALRAAAVVTVLFAT